MCSELASSALVSDQQNKHSEKGVMARSKNAEISPRSAKQTQTTRYMSAMFVVLVSRRMLMAKKATMSMCEQSCDVIVFTAAPFCRSTQIH